MATLEPLCPIVIYVAICDLTPSAWGANGKPNGDAVGLLRYGLSVLAVRYATVRYSTASANSERRSHKSSRLSRDIRRSPTKKPTPVAR